ncbi:MAG: cupin domain-containing protein [Lentisphaerales bacterium]|nr:cupin domain-containing protein [Lentisphaerales bacterium]
MKNILVVLAILLTVSVAFAHDETKNLKVRTVVKSTKSWDGKTLPAYGKGQPEITILEIEVPPKTKLPVHNHPYINAGVLISGKLKVVTEEDEVLILEPGDPIVEVIGKWHYGFNEQDTPAKIIVFYAGVKGEPTTIKQEKTK